MIRSTKSLALALTIAAMVAIPTAAGMKYPRYADNCPANDGGGGWGGSEASCNFSCAKYDVISVQVQSSDNDAKVHGRAYCADHYSGQATLTAHCDAQQACVGRGISDRSGDGRCEAWTDESWSSKMTASCSSTSSGSASPRNGGTFATRYDYGVWEDHCAPHACWEDWQSSPLSGPSVPRWIVAINVEDGVATGLVCNVESGCVDVAPTCGVEAGLYFCRIG